jgi:hypothetical protein
MVYGPVDCLMDLMSVSGLKNHLGPDGMLPLYSVDDVLLASSRKNLALQQGWTGAALGSLSSPGALELCQLVLKTSASLDV